jgi:hypothetical protein
MPTGVTHLAPETWGSDVDTFDARRFFSDSAAESTTKQVPKDEEKQRRQAFYPFGGGRNLCPGRHFAYAEIMGTVAALLLGFDIVPEYEGNLRVPPLVTKFGEGVGKPDLAKGLTKAKIRRREGWEGVKWKFSVDGH